MKSIFFDKTFEEHFNKLSSKFKGQSIDIIDSDREQLHWIVRIYTDINAGGIYHYDVLENEATLLSDVNPKLSKVELLPKKSDFFSE